MNFKYVKLPENPTEEEIKEEISRLTDMAQQLNNLQMAVKIFLNSMYGATASPYFVGYNQQLSEAITLQGQDIIKFSAKITNTYFRDYWHKDKKLHRLLGITTDVFPITTDVVNYGDTDSIYFTFQEVIKSCNWSEDPVTLIKDVTKFRLKEFYKKGFDNYAKRFNTDNIQDFELETISHSMILLAKKKYVLDIAWTDNNIQYESLSKIKSKGVEIVQSSTPLFARNHLSELLKDLFKYKKELSLSLFVGKIKELRGKFELEDIETISFGSGIGDYNKGIGNDVTKLEINQHCPIHVRGAGYHNYLINNNQKLKRKYTLVKSGDKVKYYYAKVDRTGGMNIFSYNPGAYPYEIAPPVDYDLQFSKSIIDPINRFLTAMGYAKISPELIISKQLF